MSRARRTRTLVRRPGLAYSISMKAKSPLLKIRRLLESTSVERLALDDTHVYVARASWADGPQLVAITYDGSKRREIVPESGITLGRMIADGEFIYAISDKRLVRIGKTDGEVLVLATTQTELVQLAVDGDHVYASLLGSYSKGYADGGVVRVPKDGGELEWIVPGKPVGAIVVGSGSVVFASEKELLCRDAGGEVRVLAVARNPHTIAFAGEDIIWTEFDSSGALGAISRRGGKRRDLADQTYTTGLVVIGSWIYWSQAASKRTAPAVWRIKRDGSAAEPLARFKAKAPALAGNDRILAWIDDCDGAVGALDLAQLAD
jgi:hypothetical protein